VKVITIERNYLEIKSINDLIKSNSPDLECSVDLIKPDDFQINKFFYKNVGKKHKWTDRLVWSDLNWFKYSSDPKVETYILKVKKDFAGYFELIFHTDLHEIEIAYFGLLEEYHGKKFGGFLLSKAIMNSFQKKNIKRVWVHTCTLDHKYALKNYLARGMKIFKTDKIKI
jgi:GNAT superfamily N-acetyltransferase|tara:strand:+ start:49 stop:558 length:510 start_codon:yes stop_codon:yes gene_type:complete